MRWERNSYISDSIIPLGGPPTGAEHSRRDSLCRASTSGPSGSWLRGPALFIVCKAFGPSDCMKPYSHTPIPSNELKSFHKRSRSLAKQGRKDWDRKANCVRREKYHQLNTEPTYSSACRTELLGALPYFNLKSVSRPCSILGVSFPSWCSVLRKCIYI